MQKPHLLTSSWRRFSSAFLAFLIVLATIPVTIPIAFAADCAISANTTIDSSYISTNSCSSITISGSPTITWSGTTDLQGDGLVTVQGGGTVTFSGAVVLGSTDDMTITGSTTVKHAASNTTGVNIAARNITIDSGSSINVNNLGCTGGLSNEENGYGPNTGTGVCAVTTSGYGDGATGGGAGGSHGGAGGRGWDSFTGTTYGTNTGPTLLGAGGGAAGNNDGGISGGLVRLDVTGTLTLSGSITANGQNGTIVSGSDYGSGGGSGGSVYITVGTLAGAGTVTANGGNGADAAAGDGGGGGGGRVAVYYNTLSSFTLANITATKGTKGGAQGSAVDGANGTTFILDRKSDDGIGTLTITSGLDFTDGTDFSRTAITISSGALLNCAAQTTLTISTTGNFTDNGSTFTCSSAITTMNITATGTLTTAGITWNISNTAAVNISAATWTSSGTNAMTVSKGGSDVDWNVTNALTLNNLTFTGSAGGTATNGGIITFDNAIAVSLVNTAIKANVNWTGLASLNIDSNSSINANNLGCSGGVSNEENGYGPNTGTGVCAVTTSGYGDGSAGGGGGGSHGGAGGRGWDSFTGTTYGTNTGPTLLGAGGGAGSSNDGGYGGGIVRLDVTGTLTVSGSITANGQNGTGVSDSNYGSAGGSGGSVYITAGTLAGAGTVTANGGNGANTAAGDGGGGGGGRVAVAYVTNSSTFLGSMTAANSAALGTKGGADGSAADGADGTLSTSDLPGFSSALYKDSDANGTVDQVVITFDESVSLGGTVASTRFTWTSASGDNGSAGTLSGNASASGTDVTITIGSAEANETGHITVPTIAYNDNSDDGTNKIQDTDGNIVQTFAAQNVSDGAKPVVITKQYQDVDANGTVERVLMTLSENASTQTAVIGDFAYTANDITGSALSGGTLAYPASNQVGLLLGTAGNANITGHTTAPTLAYTDGGATAIADAAGNQLATFAAANLSDGAAPIVTTRQYEDSDGNGTVERLNLTLSEAASTQTAVLGDFAYTAGSITGSALSGGTLSYPSSTAMRIVFGTAGNSGITSHSTAPTIAYTDGGSTAVADAAGNQLPTFSAITLSDAAAPAFVSARTTSTTNVRLTMSEAVSAATFGAAGGWTATGLTPSAVVINSDTTKLDLTVSAVNQGYTASNFAFTSGVSGSAISDAASNATASFTSKTVADGLAPDAPGSFTRSTGSGTTATFTWTATSDTNFNHYEIWYGTNSTDVMNRNGTASEWDNDPNDATLATRTTTTTTVTGLTAGSTYYALICAVDNASNEACSSSVSFVTNQAPTVATVTGSQATDGIGTVTISFVMDDPDDDNTLQALVEYSTNGGTSWSKATLSTANADTTATYGTPRVDNSATYQVGKASNYITSSSGVNTVTVKWQSRTDAPTANVANAKIRVTPYDGVVAGTAASSSNFILDNVDPSVDSITASQATNGTGRVSVSSSVSDTDGNGVELLLEYSTNGGSTWSRATVSEISGDVTASRGSVPTIENDNTRQLGTSVSRFSTTGGSNTVTAVWLSGTDVPTASVSNAKIRFTAYDQAGNPATEVSSSFTLDNVDPSAPVVSSATTSLGAGATWDSTITGTKDANTSIKNNGTQVVASNSSTTWSYNVVLTPGNNTYSFTSVDASGNESTAASHTIVYTQGQGGSGGGTSSGSSGTSTTTATTTTTSSTTATVTTPSTTSTTTTSGEAEVKPVVTIVTPAVPGETDSEEEDEEEDGRDEIRPITVTPIATPVVPGPKPILDQTKQNYPLAPQTPAAPSVKPPLPNAPAQPEQPAAISFSPTGVEPTASESTIEFFQPDPVKAQQKVEATIQFLAEFNSALTEMFVAQMQPNLPGLPNSAPSTSLSLGGLLLPSAPEAPVVVAQTSAPIFPVTRLDLYVDQTVSREYQRIVENTDEDILPDWWEKRYGGGDTAIMNERTDLDGDGVDDLAEFMLGTDPTSADSDGDGVSDKDEIKRGTNATSWDTDGDGVSDSAELARGTDPRKFDKVEVKGDKDGDGVPDDWTKKNDKVNKEVKFTFAMTDSDNDGLTDADELKNGTDPNVRDSDGDGVSDGAEVHDYRTNPTAATSTKELEKTQLSNVKNNRAVFSDAKPVLRGTSKPNSKVTLVFMPTREQPKTLGQLLFAAAVNSTMGGLITKEVETDSQGKFLVQPKLKDGTYSVIVRSSDAEGNPTEESLPYQIHIATELVKKALVSLSRLDNVLVDLKSSRRITLDNREPVLYGKMDKAGKGYELVALWKSDLQTVSMVVDNEDGEFVISPSEPLEDGDHNLYVYAQDPVTSVQTAAVSLDFRILAEQDYVAVNKRWNWIWNVLAFFAAGAVFSWGARRLRRARRSA